MDLKADPNTERGWRRDVRAKHVEFVVRFVRYSPLATQIPKGSAGNGLGFENGQIKFGAGWRLFRLNLHFLGPKRCRLSTWGTFPFKLLLDPEI